MSNFTHTFTRVTFRIDVRSEVAELYHDGLKTPSPSLLDVPSTTTGCTTWNDLFHPTAASVMKMQSGTGTLSYPKVSVPLEQLGSYRFVEDLFGELKAHFPKKVLQRCTQDGPALLQIPFFRHGEQKAAAAASTASGSGVAEVEEDSDSNIRGLVSTVESSVKATQSSTFAIPIEVAFLPPHILNTTPQPSSSSSNNTSPPSGVVSLRVTVLDTRLAASLSSALNNYQFISLGVGRLVKLPDPIATAMRKFEVSRRVVSGEAAMGDDEDDEHLASSRKEGDAQPNTTHFNFDDDLWAMMREDPTAAGAENKDKCFTPGSASEFDLGLSSQPIGAKRTTRSNEHPTSVTEAVLYQQLDDDTNRKDMDLDAQQLQLQQQRAAAHSEHPPPGKSFPLGQVNTLYQLALWIETHVEFVGVLSASGESASSFAFAMKRLIQLKTTVPQLLEPLDDEQAAAGTSPTSSTPTKLPFSFANHTCHYVRAVALMYGRYVLPLEEFLLLVIPQTMDIGSGGRGQDELLSCSPDGSTVMTVRELCEAMLLKDEVCEAFTPLYEYEVLRSIKGRVLRLSADVRQRERDLEEQAKRRKAQQEAALQAKVHRGGVVGGKGTAKEGGAGGEGKNLQATGSLSAAGFTSIKELSDFLRREARLANAREAHVVGFEDGELDIESDGEDADKANASKSGGGDVFNLHAAAAQKAKASSGQSGSSSAMDKDALAKAKKQQDATRLKARAAAMKSTLSFTSSFSAQAQSVLMPLLGLSEPQRADDPMYLQFSSPYFSVSDRKTL